MANDYNWMYGNSASPSLGGTSVEGGAPPATTPPSSGGSYDWMYGDQSPLSGQPSSPEGPQEHVYQDSTQPWYKRAWDWANTPITTSLFGLPEDRPGAGGFERGVEHIAAGLTSPLSLALTAATFGTGGLAASAGETALKEAATEAGEALFNPAEISQFVKASKIATDVAKSAPPIEPWIAKALQTGGHDLDLLERAKLATGPLDLSADFGSTAEQARLEAAGFSDIDRKLLAEAGNTIAKAKGTFTPVDDALKAAGIDPALLVRGQDVLKKAGLSEEDLFSKNLIQNGAFQILHHVVPDMSLAATAKAAKTANAVMNAGFTLQQFESAAQMSPRFLDALKEGDTDKAWEYGTEALAGVSLGILGTPHALHAAGELFKPLLETDAIHPSDHWLAIQRANSEREVLHAVGEAEAIKVHETALRMLGHEPPRPVLGDTPAVRLQKLQDYATAELGVHTGGDPAKAAAWHDALAEASGRKDITFLQDERFFRQLGGPDNGQSPTGTPLSPDEIPPRVNTTVLHSNKAGEVRVGEDGRPVVWLSPKAWQTYTDIVHPGRGISGVSYSPREAASNRALFAASGPKRTGGLIQDLFSQAQGASKQNLLTASRMGEGFSVVSEEAHHTAQRELSLNGEIANHLDGAVFNPDGTISVAPGSQWDRLRGIIPSGWNQHMDRLEYSNSPVVRVAETAAQFMSNRHLEAPGTVTGEEVSNFLNEYFKELEAKHGKDAIKAFNNINEIARQHVEDINAAKQAARDVSNSRSGTSGAVPKVLGGVGKGRERGNIPGEARNPKGTRGATGQEPEGLASREIPEEEHQDHPLSFASSNVHPIGSVEDAQVRLGSRPQVVSERLSRSFADALGLKTVLRPSIGHWEGGAENSIIHRYAPGTDPEAVQYHNAFMSKAGYQNFGGGFIPGEGPDVLYQFRVPGKYTAAEIGQVLEAHGIPGDTIEPVAGGHIVHIVGENGGLRPQVGEIAGKLDAERVGETNGKQFFHGDPTSRDAAGLVLENKLAELENKHPEWRGIRQNFESRPDFVELQKLVRETPKPFIEGVHGSRTPGITTLSPEKQFTGPQGGAERARAKAFPDDYVKKTYFREEGTHGETFYEKQPHQYPARFNYENLYNWVNDSDHLLPAAFEEASKRGIQNQPGAIGTIYERMMKDAGYEGYYHPGANEIAAFKDTPTEERLKSPDNGLFSRENPEWQDVKKLLTPEEREKHDTPEKQRMLTAAFRAMPNAEEWSAAVKAGKSGQLWYERSSRAFDALLDSGADWIKPKDKPKFLNFVAALSPVQTVRSNLVMAINLWAKWDKAGRPMDVEWSGTTPANKNATLYRIMKGRGQTQGVDLPARMNNAIRALQGEPLSGPKVASFAPNLGADTKRSTNDTWMAVFGDTDPNTINKPHLYDAMSARVREAAKDNKIEPRQAQAAVWSFIKSLAELSGWGKDRWIPPQEIIKQGLLTPDLVAKHAADFADMLQNDTEIRGVLKKLGGNLDALDEKLRSYVPERPVTGETQERNPVLLNAAGRLEAARSNARIQAHLARKSEPGLFNTGFNPDNGLFSRERENLAPAWYLKSNQLVDSRMQGPMPAETVLKMLENNGVKPDELKYTGLSDFLREKGKEPVRPEEVRQYLAANNLQIQEVTKGVPEVFSTQEQQRLDELEKKYDDNTDTPEENRERSMLLDRLQGVIDRGRSSTDPTKFGSYTLPGGENYRELLMTLPKGTVDAATLKTLDNAAYQKNIALNQVITQAEKQSPNGRFSYQSLTPEMQRAYDKANQELQDAEDKRNAAYEQPKGAFRSSHWGEPNVVGHIRFNDRTGPNGEKLLHLEELQSDWHQKGRQEGYKTGEETQQRAELQAAKNEYEQALSAFNKGTTEEKAGSLGERLGLASQRQFEAERSARNFSGRVPDAPFKKTWPELLMKRMIRYASEHGYDGISWTPGEEQAARYDLSKQISKVHFDDNPSGGIGRPNLEGETRNGQITAYDHNGHAVLDQYVQASELPGLIGKEAAQKLLEAEPEESRSSGIGMRRRQLSGLDLKVGGEGMKGFYDKMVPEMVNKLGKQFGAKVGETEIDSVTSAGRNYGGNKRYIVNDSRGQTMAAFEDEAEASKYAKMKYQSDPAGGELRVVDRKSKLSVPYFPITDSMRESVLSQGQPLFSRERPVSGLPDNLEEMIRDNKFKDQPKEYQDKVLNALRAVATKTVPENVQKATDYLREQQARNFEIGQSNDLLHHQIEDYMTRVYKDMNPEGRVILSQAKQGKFATNVTMARNRVYDSTLTALLKSPKEMALDPVTSTAQGRASLIKAAANRQLIDNLRDKFTRASDGRPAVVLSGSGKVVSGQNGEDPKTFVDPNRVRKINIAQPVIDQLTKSGDLQRYLDEGTIKDITPYVHPDNINTAIDRFESHGDQARADLLKSMRDSKNYSELKGFNSEIPKQYAWDPQDYISLDHNAMKGWNFITNSPEGGQVFVRSDIKVHPEFAKYLKDRLGLEPSALSQHPIGKALLGAGTKMKETLLSLSPFHMVQEALRGIMVGINPFHLTGPDILNGAKIDPLDPHSPTKIYKGVQNGLTVGTDYKSLQEHSEGVAAGGGGLLRKIPGVGKTVANAMDWYQSFLFKRYIPALKARGYELMFDRYQEAHPDWSVDRVARNAATSANNAFGGINWRAMGRSATTQDWGRLFLLAPDWLESELRSGARLFNKEEGGISRAQVAKMSMALWGIARVLNLVSTGNAHYEAPFGLAVKNKEGKETVFGIRTLPTDLLHAASDPVGFLKGRLSPTLRTGQELLTQRDTFGRKLGPEDLWADVFHQVMPIPLQSIGQAVTGMGPEIGNVGQGWKAVGGTAQTYATPAQKMAAELAANHNEDGPIDPAQMARHRVIMGIEDRVRAGELALPEVYKLVAAGQLHTDDLKRITDNIKKTQGMDASTASLYRRAARLPAPEYLKLMDQMSPAEKTALLPLTLQVRKRYISKAMKNLQPQERLQDPIFTRFINMIPEQNPF